MSYELAFLPSALREWQKLDGSIQAQFKRKLAERLQNPHVVGCALINMSNCYKIKLRSIGYRLVYQVDDKVVTVTVIAVGRRDRNLVYQSAKKRI